MYGSRFLKPSQRVPLRARLGNRALTLLTNILFRSRLTDMETAYKVFRREALDGIRLRCVGFDFEPELTAKLLLAGHAILEVPIAYNPRRVRTRARRSAGLTASMPCMRCSSAASAAHAGARGEPWKMCGICGELTFEAGAAVRPGVLSVDARPPAAPRARR